MDKDIKEMTSEDLCALFHKTRPELFDCIYKECKLIYECESGNYREHNIIEEKYWDNEELNIAKAIVYDYGHKSANEIGNIIVAATDKNIEK